MTAEPPATSTILFARHGETWRPADRYLHERDVVLTSRGVARLDALAPTLRDFAPDVALVSPVTRCVQSAARLLASTTCPVFYDQRLRERAFAPLFGMTLVEIASIYGAKFANDLWHRGERATLPRVESIHDAQARVLAAIDDLTSRYSRAVVISHGGPHSWLCCRAVGGPLGKLRRFTLDYGRYSLFERRGARLSLRAMNCGAGLPD